ncbi:Hypp2720 [Branchiostoma lanceolatum]|uniref:Hypp2720 protein n=1 Tax=Branchiostoma lanceolatum TaxID=7740 RepID=A0A8K0ERD1_BRALA|nr:Hypp2720 [Branchiostoma lanceolatum]
MKFDSSRLGNDMSIDVMTSQESGTKNRTNKEEEIEYDIDRIRKIEELRRVLQRALGSTKYPMSSARQDKAAPTTGPYGEYRLSAPVHNPAFPVRTGAGPRRAKQDGRCRAKITERPRNVAVCTVNGGVTLFQRMDKMLDNGEMETAM